ncbi:hypothetical protein [Saccharicrinis sp. FJH54]|uniref:hypothetical protein n=1 Tax=Saccharicrinis sp. FJH54 TaxID=3344665 RepID=UPI0035D43318
MTRWYASILLSVFLLQVFLPVVPWLEYYLNHKYIVENLCVQRDQEVNTCNGCCHLKEEIKKVAPQPEKNQQNSPAGKLNLKSHFDEYIISIKQLKPEQQVVKHLFTKLEFLYSYLYRRNCFHPPERIIP